MTKIKNLFIVDDCVVTTKASTALLKDYDFKVHTFHNPVEALDMMDRIPPEIILLDYFMPEMNGATFMVKVSERLLNSRDWEVFLLTSHEFTEEDAFSMKTLGISHIFQKPLSKATLADALASFEA